MVGNHQLAKEGKQIIVSTFQPHELPLGCTLWMCQCVYLAMLRYKIKKSPNKKQEPNSFKSTIVKKNRYENDTAKTNQKAKKHEFKK